MRRLLPLLLLPLLAACGRKGFVSLVMEGRRPMSRQDVKDTEGNRRPDPRTFRLVCSMCGQPVQLPVNMCSRTGCEAILTTPADVACPNCSGQGDCVACRLFGQTDQVCYFCRGAGWTPDGVECVHCDRETRRCAVCAANPGKCDLCGGLPVPGRVDPATLGGAPAPVPAATPAPAPTPEEPPPSS